MQTIQNTFPELPTQQQEQLAAWQTLFTEWNQKINLVSRQDIENLEIHHLLHTLLLNKCVELPKNYRVLDFGTGGGLPGIPLAITNPKVHFTLIDSVGKKITAVQAMVDALGLENVTVINGRVEKLQETFHFITGRAVTSFPKFLPWFQPLLKKGGPPQCPNGVLYFKGSLYKDELHQARKKLYKAFDLGKICPEIPYFQEKFVVYLRQSDLYPKKGRSS